MAAKKRASISGCEPQLFVRDIAAACAFYTEQLGFTTEFIYGDPPSYAQVSRDEARLNLRAVDEPVFAEAIRKHESLLSATLTVARAIDVQSLFDEFSAAAIAFHQPLQTEEWGARTFVVADPDGNLLLFAGPDT